MLNPTDVKKDFPIFQQTIHGKPLIFLDNASSTQKPQCVIDSIVRYYSQTYANIHRGVYKLSEKASYLYDSSRETVKEFINAKHAHEVIFVKGTTEASNLVAESFGQAYLKPGDNIIITAMEHHSNLIPWQYICQKMGAELRVIPIHDSGDLDLTIFETLLTPRTKLVALSHISNLLGTVNPIKVVTQMAHAYKAAVLIDGAQAISHIPVDVQELDCDFYTFSGHKMYAPTGIGVLYGKTQYLETMPPYQRGGGMIEQVSFEKTTYATLPAKFEAGTPHIAGAIGLMEAIHYLNHLKMHCVQALEETLQAKALTLLQKFNWIKILGNPAQRSSVISFTMNHIHPHDAATILDQDGIAVRAGHHCAMPLIHRFNIPAALRISFGVYNTPEELDILAHSLDKARTILG